MQELMERSEHSGIGYKMPSGIQLNNLDTCWQDWNKFKEAFKIFIMAAGFEKITESRKAALLLNCIGSQALDLYITVLKVEEKPKVDDVISLFDNYFKPKQNQVMCSYHFNRRNQEDGETFDQYYTALKRLADACDYGDLKERMLRDRIVIGVKQQRVQQKLLDIRDLTLEKAVDTCRAAELSSGHIHVLHNEDVHAVGVNGTPQQLQHTRRDKYLNNKNRAYSDSRNSFKIPIFCKKCNNKHVPKPNLCPAYGKICSFCHKANHSKDACHKLKSKQKLGLVHTINLRSKEWTKLVKVENQMVRFKCDTGAQINVMSIKDYKNLVNDEAKLPETKTILEVFGGGKLFPIGQVSLKVYLYDDTYKSITFLVVKENVRPILGLKSLLQLKILHTNTNNMVRCNDTSDYKNKHVRVCNRTIVYGHNTRPRVSKNTSNNKNKHVRVCKRTNVDSYINRPKVSKNTSNNTNKQFRVGNRTTVYSYNKNNSVSKNTSNIKNKQQNECKNTQAYSYNCKKKVSQVTSDRKGNANDNISDGKITIINRFKQLFQGVGEFNSSLKLRIQPGTEPVVRPPRRVPNALMGRLADKLEALVKHKVIAKVDHPKSYVSNLVIIEKKDGSLRICLDPKDLNKVLIREHHLIPTIEEIVSKICNKKVFSVLDLSDGFYNIKLSEDSNDLCTFNSPFGCYKFLRMPFGLSIAPEIFQKYSENAFGDIPGVIVYCDDLLICGINEQEHDTILNKVFERAKLHNVRFNKNKFQYKLKEVKYFGHIFSEKGMKIDPERVNAITSMPSPKNKKELQIFLGMVNYLRKFIHKLADIASPLQLLLKKDVDWLWTEIHENVYKNIKNKIISAPHLQNFDNKLPITIQCDASKSGLGCCLLQNGKPVCYASRSLTPAECNFSQIEKELLSIVWATRKFHYYIYGHKITVVNDHKPLESLLKKHLHEVPSPRLQRLKLKLLKYNLEFKYLKGKFMYIADLLSRSYQKCSDTDESYMYEVIHCIGLAKSLECTDEQKLSLISESTKDQELIKLSELIKNGWPDKICDVQDSIRIYHKLRAELSVDENLIFYNDRLIVPKNLRLTFLNNLHEGHIGMSKMKQLARKLYYWPYMDNHIEEFVKKCFPCQTHHNNNVKEPLLSHEIPKLPFSKLGIDIMEFRSKSYLVIYDYYSKWLDVKAISNKSSISIINRLIDIFSNFGIPREIVADHVPFDSRECKQFAQQMGFKFTYTSPRYAQANGMAERGVQIAKKIFNKCQEDKTDIRLALLKYRSSPVSGTNFSPSELLMNRNLRTKLIVNSQYLKSKLNNSIASEFSKVRSRNVKNYNKTSRIKKEFLVGQNIWYKKDPNKNVWLKGKIIKKNNFRSYTLIDNNNDTFVRTSYHIRPA